MKRKTSCGGDLTVISINYSRLELGPQVGKKKTEHIWHYDQTHNLAPLDPIKFLEITVFRSSFLFVTVPSFSSQTKLRTAYI